MADRWPERPWTRMPGEGERHHGWFQVFLDSRDRFGRRSTGEVAKRVKVSTTMVRRVATKFRWKERALAVDKYINTRVSKQVRRAIKNLTRRHVQAIESAFHLSDAMERKLIDMLACDVMERVEENPFTNDKGETVYQRITYTAPRWSYDSCVKMLKTICELRENALLLTIDLESGRPADRRKDKADDQGDDQVAARAEALRAALVAFHTQHPRPQTPPIPRPGEESVY